MIALDKQALKRKTIACARVVKLYSIDCNIGQQVGGRIEVHQECIYYFFLGVSFILGLANWTSFFVGLPCGQSTKMAESQGSALL